MSEIEHTRLELVYRSAFILAPIEGLLKVLLPAFPLTELFAFEGMIIGGYLTVKTISNYNQWKVNNVNKDKPMGD